MPARERAKKTARKASKKRKSDPNEINAGEGEQEPIKDFRRETTDEDTVVDGKGKQKKQARLPGQERPTDKQVEKKALALYATQTERLALQQREKEERADLHATMKAKKIDRQVLPGGLVAEIKVSEEKALVHKTAEDEEVS